MQRTHLIEDLQPLSSFRAKVASFIDQVHKTKRPLVITQHGKSSAILIDVGAYEKMVDKMEILADIAKSEEDIKNKRVFSNSAAKDKILAKIK